MDEYILYMCMYNVHYFMQGVAGNPVVPMAEFVNSKLTSKANRQMQGTHLMYMHVQVHTWMCIFFIYTNVYTCS